MKADQMNFRLNATEKKVIEKAAKKADLAPSTFARQAAVSAAKFVERKSYAEWLKGRLT